MTQIHADGRGSIKCEREPRVTEFIVNSETEIQQLNKLQQDSCVEFLHHKATTFLGHNGLSLETR